MNIRGPEWIVLLLIVLLLFGATKLPALGKSLGQTWREFRKEVSEPTPPSGDSDTKDGADTTSSSKQPPTP